MSGAVEGQSPPGRLFWSASRGQGDITQDLMPFTTSPPSHSSSPPPSLPLLTPNKDPTPVLQALALHTLLCVFNAHRRMPLHQMPLYGAFPHTNGQSLFTEGRVGSSSRKNTDLLPAASPPRPGLEPQV